MDLVIQLTLCYNRGMVLLINILIILKLPYLLRCSLPDRLDVKVRSL
jgi:hypothetical protein